MTEMSSHAKEKSLMSPYLVPTDAKGRMKLRLLIAAVASFAMFAPVAASRASQPICTNVATSFSPTNPVSAGTTVDVTGTVTQAGAVNGCAGGSAGTPVTVGTMTEEENEIGGVGVPCGHGILYWRGR